MKTTTVPVSAPAWYVVDAEGQTLGHIATTVAHVLRGKHKAHFSPHQLCGDQVVVINAGKLAFEQRKLMQKEYVSHSGYMGHTKAVRLKDLVEKHPDRVIAKAVQGMLPKNKLRNDMMKRLHIYVATDHNHEAQKPVPLSVDRTFLRS